MKKIILSFTSLALLAIAGCKKDLLDINTNPNSATYSTPQLTMPLALEGAARISQTQYFNLAYWTGYWATSSGFSKPTETYTYNITSNFQSGTWDALYDNIADFDYIEKSSLQQNLPVYRAIAKVMKAYDFHQLVDLWGNVPYTEALKGAANISPKYDQGQAIYEDLVKQIDSAVLIFKSPAALASISVSTDMTKVLLFGSTLNTTDPTGSSKTFLNKWVKFSNSLKLQLLVNQSQISGRDAYIKGELSGLTSSDFLGLGEDAVVNPGYQASTGKTNPFYGAFYKSPGSAGDNYNSIRASDYAAKAYTNNNDPRISFYYNKGSQATYLGSVFGDPTGTGGAASVGTGLLQITGNAILMIAAESLFLQSEAVQRGYIAGNAKQLFQNGVLASFQFDNVADAANTATAYLAQANPDVNWDLATDKIKVIITQKWFAINGIDILTSYNDYRRTGYPNVPLSTDPNSSGRIPVRVLYPQREITTNGANVTAQGNVDPYTTTVFWDK